MDAFKPYGDLDARVHVSLSEDEAKALWALACYGADGFLKVFYKEMGQAYLKPHEKGLRSLFENAASQVEAVTRHLDITRAVFRGSMAAIRPDDLKRLRDAASELRDLKAAQSSEPAPIRAAGEAEAARSAPDTPNQNGSDQ